MSVNFLKFFQMSTYFCTNLTLFRIGHFEAAHIWWSCLFDTIFLISYMYIFKVTPYLKDLKISTNQRPSHLVLLTSNYFNKNQQLLWYWYIMITIVLEEIFCDSTTFIGCTMFDVMKLR